MVRKRTSVNLTPCFIAISFLVLANPYSRAATANWVVWTNFPSSYGSSVVAGGTTYNYATFASGYIIDPSTGLTNQVTYNGEVNSATASKLAIWANSSTYTSATVSNLPSPNNSYIALTGYPNLTNQLTFSLPISNFVMNIASLGNPSTTASYNFDSAPVVLSQGSGYWGAQTTPLSVSGNVVSAREGNGTIQFNGTFTSLIWTTPADEFYSAFTIGATSQAAVPEPSALSLLAVGLGGVIALRRVNRKADSV
ncbi:MAG: PEP-CTERM sorting domain-containing protein [Verrucomicrobia bacterium]|nr:PEP-CTERM sorting domain-containing protein [Verrucomicrobiota bacterium]